MKYGALLLVAGAAFASAQQQQEQFQPTDIPACAQKCFLDNSQRVTGCQPLDTACQCRPENHDKLQQVVTPCVTSNCNFFEGLRTLQVSNGLCAQAGFPQSSSAGGAGGMQQTQSGGAMMQQTSSSGQTQGGAQSVQTQGGDMAMTAMGVTPTVNPYLGTEGLSYTGPNIPSTPTYAQPTAYTGAAEPLHVAGSFGGAVVAVAAALAL